MRAALRVCHFLLRQVIIAEYVLVTMSLREMREAGIHNSGWLASRVHVNSFDLLHRRALHEWRQVHFEFEPELGRSST